MIINVKSERTYFLELTEKDMKTLDRVCTLADSQVRLLPEAVESDVENFVRIFRQAMRASEVVHTGTLFEEAE